MKEILQISFIHAIEKNEVTKVMKLLRYTQENCFVLNVSVDVIELLFG